MKKTNIKKHNYLVLKIVLVLLTIFFVMSISFAIYVVINAPKFDKDLLYTRESTVILDKNGKEIIRLGEYNRELVKYNELPQVLVDAIIATEDSRFFQHNGFDIARFIKAISGHLEGNSAAGGASTITMQLSKNAYTSTQTHGIEGIVRKATDIYLSIFKIETTFTKEEILEIYVNYPYLGNGCYGVEMASYGYFGKSVKELSLPEAALLAGLFNAPSENDPFVHLDSAEKRKNEVLDLMYKHKYISEEQLNDAKSITVSSLLDKDNEYKNIYQDFIDTVVENVIKDTGLNPYSTPMIVYSTMDPKVQDALNTIMNNKNLYRNRRDKLDDVIQAGIAITATSDGSISGIGAGRNRTGALSWNYATMISRHPGSSIKPFMDYGPLFEFNGATPETVLYDTPYTYTNGTNIYNADRTYRGAMTIKEALAQSRNIPALKAFQQVDKTKISNYVHSFGIDYGDILYESCSIGGFEGVSPLQMSAAYGAYARGGYYIEPYAYTKIVYRDTDEVYTKNIKRVKVCSWQTAKYINDILIYAQQRGALGSLNVGSGDVAVKTGTSTVGGAGIRKYKLNPSAIMDSWACLYSADFSVAIWYGYDTIDSKHYMLPNTGDLGRMRISRKVVNTILKTSKRLTTS